MASRRWCITAQEKPDVLRGGDEQGSNTGPPPSGSVITLGQLGDPVGSTPGIPPSGGVAPAGSPQPGYSISQLAGGQKPRASRVLDDNGEPQGVYHGHGCQAPR